MERIQPIGVQMTEEEIQYVSNLIPLKGNIVSAKKYGNTKAIIVDGAMAKTKDERRVVLDDIARVISKQTPGWECSIKDPLFD